MKQTAVEQLGIAFREWQREWDNYDGKKESKPKSFDEFINPFLETEKQQIIDARVNGVAEGIDIGNNPITEDISKNHEIYYNQTFKTNKPDCNDNC